MNSWLKRENYSLIQAAKVLSVNPEDLIEGIRLNEIECWFRPFDDSHFKYKVIKPSSENQSAIEIINNNEFKLAGRITSLSTKRTTLGIAIIDIQVDIFGHIVSVDAQEDNLINPLDMFSINQIELTRLQELKAAFEKKPTYQQLEQKLIQANSRITDLESRIESNRSTGIEPRENSKQKINAFFKALNAEYPTLRIKEIAEKSEALGDPISEKTIYKYLDKGI